MKLSQSVLLLVYSLLTDVTAQESRQQVELEYEVSEEVVVGTIVGDVKGDFLSRRSHLDASVRREFRMFQSSVESFGIDSATGLLRIASHLDREALLDTSDCNAQACHVPLLVAVIPGSTPQLEVVAVTVEVKDVNDNPPRFGKSQVALQVLESAEPQRTTLSLPLATDVDSEAFQIKRYELQPKNDAVFELQVSAAPSEMSRYLLLFFCALFG